MNRTRIIPRGIPGFAETQREEIVRMLQEAGRAGVSRALLIFEKHFTQCGARVDELKRMGYVIESELRDGEKYVRYVLKSEPLELKPVPDSLLKMKIADWFVDSTGRERPKGKEDLGPLFTAVGDSHV